MGIRNHFALPNPSSGIPSYTAVKRYWDITRQHKSHDEIIDLVRDMPLSFAPGTRHAYDNTGYYLLGMIIEAVAQKPYGDYLQDLIFKPLGMSHTQVNDYDMIIPNRVQGYVYRSGTLYNKECYDTSNTFSAGILLSTVRDLLAWRTSLFTDTILNAHYRQLWWTPHPSQARNEREFNFTLGLGWFIVDEEFGQFLGHSGGIQGFASTLMYFPKTDMMAVILLNASDVNEPHKILSKIIGSLGLEI